MYRPAALFVHYTTCCKHSLVLLRMGEIIARNMLSWLELSINRYCCIYLVVYVIVLVMHGHTNIKRSFICLEKPLIFSLYSNMATCISRISVIINERRQNEMVSFCVGKKENKQENEEENVNSYWMTCGNEKLMEFERGSSKSPVPVAALSKA